MRNQINVVIPRNPMKKVRKQIMHLLISSLVRGADGFMVLLDYGLRRRVSAVVWHALCFRLPASQRTDSIIPYLRPFVKFSHKWLRQNIIW